MNIPLKITTTLCGVLVGATLTGAAAPAYAQSTVEELTVIGHYGRVPDSAQTASQVVSYADLDLSTAAGQKELKHRISLTARYLCDKLGESDTSTTPGPTCRDAATKDAWERAGTVEAGFAPRGGAWVAPRAWQPPYPVAWENEYP